MSTRSGTRQLLGVEVSPLDTMRSALRDSTTAAPMLVTPLERTYFSEFSTHYPSVAVFTQRLEGLRHTFASTEEADAEIARRTAQYPRERLVLMHAFVAIKGYQSEATFGMLKRAYSYAPDEERENAIQRLVESLLKAHPTKREVEMLTAEATRARLEFRSVYGKGEVERESAVQRSIENKERVRHMHRREDPRMWSNVAELRQEARDSIVPVGNAIEPLFYALETALKQTTGNLRRLEKAYDRARQQTTGEEARAVREEFERIIAE